MDMKKLGNRCSRGDSFLQACTIILTLRLMATMKPCFCPYLKYSVGNYWKEVETLQKVQHFLSSIETFTFASHLRFPMIGVDLGLLTMAILLHPLFYGLL